MDPSARSFPRLSRLTSRAGVLREGTSVHTAYYYLRDTAERVNITRRHHPLKGVSVQVLKGGKDLIVRLRDGSTTRLPRCWTDADGVPESSTPQLSLLLSVESLRELICLLDALKQRC